MINETEKEQILSLCRKMTHEQQWSLGLMLLKSSNLRTEQEIKEIWQIATPEQKLRLKAQKNEPTLRLKKENKENETK